MEFTVENNDPLVVVLSGSVIGGAGALEFTRTVGDALRTGTRRVVVDLAEVPVMNSSGLGMLVSTYTTVRNSGGMFVLAGANEKILNLFKMTRLDLVFTHYPTRDEAMSAS